MERHTVLISKSHADHEEVCEKVTKIVEEIATRNGGIALPHTENSDIYQFEYLGTMIDGLPCMAAGAMSVS